MLLNQSGERASSRDASKPVRLRLIDEDSFNHFGEMAFVDNRSDRSTGTVRSCAIFDNSECLLTPGMFAHLQAIASGEYEAVLIPDTAVQTDQRKKFVWVAVGGVAERRTVELGPLHEGLCIVRSGLSDQDQLITTGTPFIRPGAAIAAAQSDPIHLAASLAT
ncbi:MAG: efflux RND transporter periplasmic adaptor subunit [Pseudomonadota bacterium]